MRSCDEDCNEQLGKLIYSGQFLKAKENTMAKSKGRPKKVEHPKVKTERLKFLDFLSQQMTPKTTSKAFIQRLHEKLAVWT